MEGIPTGITRSPCGRDLPSDFAADGFTYGSTHGNWKELAAWARAHDKLFIPCVAPGYIDTRIRPWNGRNTRGRAIGAYYDQAFEAAIAAGPDVIGMTLLEDAVGRRCWKTLLEDAVGRRCRKTLSEDTDTFGRHVWKDTDQTRHVWKTQIPSGATAFGEHRPVKTRSGETARRLAKRE